MDELSARGLCEARDVDLPVLFFPRGSGTISLLAVALG